VGVGGRQVHPVGFTRCPQILEQPGPRGKACAGDELLEGRPQVLLGKVQARDHRLGVIGDVVEQVAEDFEEHRVNRHQLSANSSRVTSFSSCIKGLSASMAGDAVLTLANIGGTPLLALRQVLHDGRQIKHATLTCATRSGGGQQLFQLGTVTGH